MSAKYWFYGQIDKKKKSFLAANTQVGMEHIGIKKVCVKCVKFNSIRYIFFLNQSLNVPASHHIMGSRLDLSTGQ